MAAKSNGSPVDCNSINPTMAKSREVWETGPESRYLIHRQWGYGAFGGLHPQPTQDKSWPTDAHRCTRPVSLLKPGSHLPRSIGEYGAQGAIDNGDALVDSTVGQLALLTGLESHVVQQCR